MDSLEKRLKELSDNKERIDFASELVDKLRDLTKGTFNCSYSYAQALDQLLSEAIDRQKVKEHLDKVKELVGELEKNSAVKLIYENTISNQEFNPTVAMMSVDTLRKEYHVVDKGVEAQLLSQGAVPLAV